MYDVKQVYILESVRYAVYNVVTDVTESVWPMYSIALTVARDLNRKG